MSARKVKVILRGGPDELAAADVSISQAELHRTLKIGHLDGYEHFVLDGECRTVDGRDTAVFRWTYRTKIAE